jgi:hypothetical protein
LTWGKRSLISSRIGGWLLKNRFVLKSLLGISLNPAIMHSAQLCAVMLGDSDRSPMGIGFVPFGAAIFWT